MLLKDLLLITFGGGGFLGLMGTSGYFVYRQEAIKGVERDISITLGEINTKVQILIGKKVDENGEIITINGQGVKVNDNETASKLQEPEKSQKIQEINGLINSAKDKNKNWWSLYVDGINSILTRYEEIVKKEKENPLEALLKSKQSSKKVPAKPRAKSQAKPKK